jgi:hypothetical protein
MNHSGSKDNLAPQEGHKTLAMRLLLARATSPEGALHLCRLDADHRDKLTLSFAPLLPVPVPEVPIKTLAALRYHLLDPLVEPQLQDHLLKFIAWGVKVMLEQRPEEVTQ